MVKIGHSRTTGVPELPYAPPTGTPDGVEVMTLTELQCRVPAGRLAMPQRPGFHQLITLNGGTLGQTIDFTDYTLQPGDWLWARPGQVQQWGNLQKAHGHLVLFQANFLDQVTASKAQLDDPHQPVMRRAPERDAGNVRMALDHLTAEFQAFGRMPLESHALVLRQLLAVLVLRLTHVAQPVATRTAVTDPAFLRFRSAVENDFTRTRRVDDYARSLGYSARTLSRASLSATGVPAKEFIDRRVILEAKRLLAHSDQSATQISRQLGFRSATQFAKYFYQRTGQTPLAFRDSVHA